MIDSVHVSDGDGGDDWLDLSDQAPKLQDVSMENLPQLTRFSYNNISS